MNIDLDGSLISLVAEPLRSEILRLGEGEDSQVFDQLATGLGTYLVGMHESDDQLLLAACVESSQALEAGLRSPFLRACAASVAVNTMLLSEESGTSGGEPGRVARIALATSRHQLFEALSDYQELIQRDLGIGGNGLLPLGVTTALQRLVKVLLGDDGLEGWNQRFEVAGSVVEMAGWILPLMDEENRKTLIINLRGMLCALDGRAAREGYELPFDGASPTERFAHLFYFPLQDQSSIERRPELRKDLAPMLREVSYLGVPPELFDTMAEQVDERVWDTLLWGLMASTMLEREPSVGGGCVEVGFALYNRSAFTGAFAPRLDLVALTLFARGGLADAVHGDAEPASLHDSVASMLVEMVQQYRLWRYLGLPRERRVAQEGPAQPALPSIWSETLGQGMLISTRIPDPLPEAWLELQLEFGQLLLSGDEARQLFEREQLVAIAACYQAAADRTGIDPGVGERLAEIAQRLGDLSGLTAASGPPTRSERARPADPQATELLRKAVEAKEDGDLEQAVRYATLAVRHAPTSSDAVVYLSVLLGLAGEAERALAVVAEGLSEQPDNADLHMLQARLLLERGEYEPARVSLERARRLGVEDEDAEALAAALPVWVMVAERWLRVQGDDGNFEFLPLEWEAMVAVQERIDHALEVGNEGVAELLEPIQQVLQRARERVYRGGFSVPLATVGLGLFGIATATVSLGLFGNATSVAIGGGTTLLMSLLYLACAVAYIHAARPQRYKVYRKIAEGENEAGAGAMLADQFQQSGSLGEGIISVLFMSFCCVGPFAPVAVLYQYFMNYLLK